MDAHCVQKSYMKTANSKCEPYRSIDFKVHLAAHFRQSFTMCFLLHLNSPHLSHLVFTVDKLWILVRLSLLLCPLLWATLASAEQIQPQVLDKTVYAIITSI